MLQQTQVDRVVDKYLLFIRTFPTFQTLAQASMEKLLATWQGLGYNRRALLLRACAQQVIKRHGGSLPDTPESLAALPGIGKATAASICAFAFNKPVIFIETNIRAVFIHEFFQDKNSINDRELIPIIESTLDRKKPGTWYSALMDYGTHLKKKYPNPGRRSAHHTRQSKFAGSDRQLRGKILRLLLSSGRQYLRGKELDPASDPERVNRILRGLTDEGFLVKKGDFYAINRG
jgi:A/G-specific adenine glycosylase